jgi:hypothetical protein
MVDEAFTAVLAAAHSAERPDTTAAPLRRAAEPAV